MSSFGWLFIILILSFVEITTVNLTTVWFVVSGIISLCLSFVIESDIILFSIFIVGGILLLVITRPLINKYVKVKGVPTNLDRIIGSVGTVTEDIVDGNIGEVKVDGKRWSAVSKDNLLKEEKVIVNEINGVKLIVRRRDV